VDESAYAIYIHIPFCLRRCRYCDFFSTEGRQAQIPEYVAALEREIDLVGQAGSRPPAVSVYFGGGTPSLLTPVQAGRILAAAARSFRLESDAEI
jgi:oxygen-independent coproporphyrinogen-3 oxidase